MSCAKPSKTTMKVVIYIMCGWLLLGSISNICVAFSGGAANHIIGAALGILVAGLGIQGANKENIPMLKAFAITLSVLVVLVVIAMIILSLIIAGAFDFHSNQTGITSFITIIYVLIVLTLALEITAAVYGFLLVKLLKQEKDNGAVYSVHPAPEFHNIAGATLPPPYEDLKFTEPKV